MIIEIPDNLSEFDIQADLYFDLRNLGYTVRGEVHAPTSEGKIRIDLVVFKYGIARILIEVKNSDCLELLDGRGTRQIRKYKECQIPFMLYTTAIPKEVIIDRVHQIMDEAPVTEKCRHYFGLKFLIN